MLSIPRWFPNSRGGYYNNKLLVPFVRLSLKIVLVLQPLVFPFVSLKREAVLVLQQLAVVSVPTPRGSTGTITTNCWFRSRIPKKNSTGTTTRQQCQHKTITSNQPRMCSLASLVLSVVVGFRSRPH